MLEEYSVGDEVEAGCYLCMCVCVCVCVFVCVCLCVCVYVYVYISKKEDSAKCPQLKVPIFCSEQ